MVKVSAKPLYLFQTLMRYLEAQHIVVPGYSVLQDIVSRALAAERQRITTMLDRTLDPATRAALDELYVNREGVYAITALKRRRRQYPAHLGIARAQSDESKRHYRQVERLRKKKPRQESTLGVGQYLSQCVLIDLR